MNDKSWLLRLYNFLWFLKHINWCQFVFCKDLIPLKWLRLMFVLWIKARLVQEMVLEDISELFLDSGLSLTCVTWSSICGTGNPNWWVWIESLLCSWKWVGCSLSNLLVLVDGTRAYEAIKRWILGKIVDSHFVTGFWCNANARVEVVSYFCVASKSWPLVSLLLIVHWFCCIHGLYLS